MDYMTKKTRSKPKPKPDFEIRLVADRMKPWEVPMRALANVLNAVQRLMEPSDEDTEDKAKRDEDEITVGLAPLHLIGVVSRSAGYSVSAQAAQQAIATLEETGRILDNPDASDWTPELLSPVEELSRMAKALECTIEFKRPGRDGNVLAQVRADSYAKLTAMAFVTGDSSVYGYLERVGGATEQRCGLRLPNQARKMVYCTVHGEDLVRELGRHIYENVYVSGTMTWLRKNWHIKHILVKGFEPSKTGSILDALERIYQAGGKAWDEVDDPEGLIAEMRGS